MLPDQLPSVDMPAEPPELQLKKYKVLLSDGRTIGTGPTTVRSPTVSELQGTFGRQPKILRSMQQSQAEIRRILEQ